MEWVPRQPWALNKLAAPLQNTPRKHPFNVQVFTDPNLDQSLVIEVLEQQTSVPDSEAALFFFDDLASNNEAAMAQVVTTRDNTSHLMISKRCFDAAPNK
jgi:hypothetical protein